MVVQLTDDTMSLTDNMGALSLSPVITWCEIVPTAPSVPKESPSESEVEEELSGIAKAPNYRRRGRPGFTACRFRKHDHRDLAILPQDDPTTQVTKPFSSDK